MGDSYLITDRLRLNLQYGNHVTIDRNTLDKTCDLIERKEIKVKPFDWRNPLYWLEDEKGKAKVSQFFTIGNSINFRYWWIGEKKENGYCEGKKGGVETRGAYYMWRSLKVCLDQDFYPMLDARKLSKITLKEVKGIFQDDKGALPMPGCEERLKNWRDLGKKLYEYWSGEFYNLVKETRGSLYQFIQYSRQFRAFDDPLCKMTMVNAIMHQGRGLTTFDEPIFPAVDDKLPNQQVRIGILVVDKKVGDKLKKRAYLSPDETRELRNASLDAFIYMMKKTGLTGDVIDNMFWFNRTKCRTETPVCEEGEKIEKCLFHEICKRKVEYKFHLTKGTRYF